MGSRNFCDRCDEQISDDETIYRIAIEPVQTVFSGNGSRRIDDTWANGKRINIAHEKSMVCKKCARAVTSLLQMNMTVKTTPERLAQVVPGGEGSNVD